MVLKTPSKKLPLDSEVFHMLLSDSYAGTLAPARRALETGEITFSDLKGVCEAGRIPYALFFCPRNVVAEQLRLYHNKLYGGMTKEFISMNTRDAVEIGAIELVVRDLVNKQQYLKKLDPDLIDNTFIGCLRRKITSIEDAAARLLERLEIDLTKMRTAKNKGDALNYVIDCLAKQQILVARNTQGFSPTYRRTGRFSGMAIKDKKIPYIFLASGTQNEAEELPGRQIFTLFLLLVLIARGKFSPVQFATTLINTGDHIEFDIAAAMLMPARDVMDAEVSALSDIKTLAKRFHVTPSAVTVRLARLKLLSWDDAMGHLESLRAEYNAAPKSKGGVALAVANGIARYAGREYVTRMFRALDSGAISPGDFCRVVCSNRVRAFELPQVRAAINELR